MEYLEPWQAEFDSTLVAELQREIPQGHILFGVSVSPVARRGDRDVVLFSILDGSDRVALVHMTWSIETSPNYPRTKVFESLRSWAETCMISDHVEFTA